MKLFGRVWREFHTRSSPASMCFEISFEFPTHPLNAGAPHKHLFVKRCVLAWSSNPESDVQLLVMD